MIHIHRDYSYIYVVSHMGKGSVIVGSFIGIPGLKYESTVNII